LLPYAVLPQAYEREFWGYPDSVEDYGPSIYYPRGRSDGPWTWEERARGGKKGGKKGGGGGWGGGGKNLAKN